MKNRNHTTQQSKYIPKKRYSRKKLIFPHFGDQFRQAEENHISFKRYYCKENIFFNNSNHNDSDILLNDFVDFIYKEQNNKINIEIQIWKLIKKDENFISHRNDGMYYIGDYDDKYYWKDIIIKYSL